MKLFLSFCFCFGLLLNLPAVAQTVQATSPAKPTAAQLFNAVQHAYRNGNFELVAQRRSQNSVEPLQLFHGVDQGREVEHQLFLNGPVQEILKIGDAITFFEQGHPPFTLANGQLPGLLPKLMSIEPAQLNDNYRLILSGRNRIAGRIAYQLRITPKDRSLYPVQIWVDEESFLPLQLDLLDKQGELIEQFMVLSMRRYQTPPPWLAKLLELELPAAVELPASEHSVHYRWEVDWLPRGMQVVYADTHVLATNPVQVAYQKYSNGLIDISLYASIPSPSGAIRQQRVRQGMSSLYSEVRGGLEITVVGEIPVETAQRIAESVTLYPLDPK